MDATKPDYRGRDYWLARNTAADKSVNVKVTQRYAVRAVTTRVTGSEQDVFDHVAWMLQNDTCTPMYEHMLMQVISISYDTGTGDTTVLLYQSLYAGD